MRFSEGRLWAEGEELLDFWRAAGAEGEWFAQRGAFDRHLRERFLPLHEEAAAGALDAWSERPEGALALLILLDQFPRNAFRGTPRMYQSDALARRYARKSLHNDHIEAVESDLRLFFALPFSHSENLADQEVSLVLNRRLGEPWLSHARGHYEIIRRFGRFPHRNEILGRESSRQELAFLRNGGFAG